MDVGYAADNINPTFMQCILYARVSTERQIDRDLSIPAQLAAMRAYAMARCWPNVEEFVEGGRRIGLSFKLS